MRLPGSARAVTEYLANPRKDYHQLVADICGITRKQAKPINLGLGYGMGGAKLCRSLGLPTEWIEVVDKQTGKLVKIEVAGPEGKQIIASYHGGVPFVKGLFEACSNQANARGYIKTILGRRCRYPVMHDGRRWRLHTAMNRLIQGSAADQIKKAAHVMYYQHGVIPLALVHDEDCLSVSSQEEADLYAQVMCDAIPLEVPVICDAKVGDSWGDCKD